MGLVVCRRDRFVGLLDATMKRLVALASAAELRGELTRASALFAKAGQIEEADRVMVLRGDREPGADARVRFYAQAMAMAPEGSPVRGLARVKRALAELAMAAEAPVTGARRQGLLRAAGELESAGDHAHASAAYALANDIAGQARALAEAGAVDVLEAVLTEDLERSRDERSLREAHGEFGALVAGGNRRQALALAHARNDEALRERARTLESRRIRPGVVRAAVLGCDVAVILGREVIIGRAPGVPSEDLGKTFGALTVPSATLSRRHVAIARRGGDIFVRDLASRNGTRCHSGALQGELRVGAELQLRLGADVTLVIRADGPLPGTVAIEIGAASYVAPLDDAAWLGVGRWRLVVGAGEWVELVTESDPPAFARLLQMAPCVTLLCGDALGDTRDGAPCLVLREVPERDEARTSC
jgi:hypothetical protein